MILRLLVLLLVLLGTAHAQSPPPPAAAVGYNRLTYGPNVTVGANPTTVPLSPGSNWQPFAFFGNTWQSLSSVITQNADGSVTLGTNIPGGFGNMLSTAAPINNVSQKYIQGTAFGGGFYAEVTMAFTLNFGPGGPAFWANDIESMAGGSEGDVSLRHWPGQIRNFGDWIENDITEFDSNLNSGGGCANLTQPCLGFALHNFYGPGGEFGGETFQSGDETVNAGNLYTQTVSPTCVTSNSPNVPPTGTGTGIVDGTCRWNFVSTFSPSSPVSTSGSGSRALQPNGTNFAQPHKYAVLWVPATATTQGSVKYYFDGVQIGNTCTWNQYNPSAAPPPVDNSSPCGGSSAYSVMDTRHMALILGNATQVSGQNPGAVTVTSVVVWQKDASQDLGPTNPPVSASGTALPSGYESVAGNQIQDGLGNNLRWACTQRRSGPPDQAGMNAIRAAGFNCIRVSYRDAFLSGASTPSGASCDAGMSSMVTCVSEATNAGLKVILEHLGNEAPSGVNNACVGQQKNGLWYDLNAAAPFNITQNQDGCGDTGTITYAAFKQNWVNLATQFAGNSTVIGMDLHNEPLTYGTNVNAQVNWGGSSGGSGTGQFVASAGKITDPNGTAWVGRGFNVTTEDVQAGNVPLSTIQRLFPRANYVRVSNFLGGGYTDGNDPTNSTISAWVTSLTNVGIRVEFSDYGPNSAACRTGSDLANESNWLKKVATFYASNPFVGYESQNECFDSSTGPFTWAPQVTSNYKAVRGGWFPGITIPSAGYVVSNVGNMYTAQAACTGNTSGTGPGGTGSGIVDGSCRWNFAASNPTPSGGAPKSLFLIGSPGGNFTSGGTYLNSQLPLSTMTNVAWDLHPYAGTNQGNGCCGYVGAGVAATQAAYDTFLSNAITAWQGWTTTSEGAIPVIAGEFGNSSNGSAVDPTGQLATQAGADELSTTGGLAGVGYWLWFCSCNPAGVADQITTGGSNPSINTVNAYGPSVQTIIANAPGSGPSPLSGGGGGTTPACTVAAAANSCSLTQTQVNAVMSAINTQQQIEVPGGECFGGPCHLQDALVGDTIVTTAGGLQLTGPVPVSLTDSANNTWTLHAGQTCQGNAPNWWWGGIDLNGQQQFCGYSIAIRKLANGHVWVEEAKQGGWWDLTAVQAGATLVRGGDPGPGPNNVNPTTVGGADLQAMCNDVGGAVHAANSGVIIICEGAQTNAALFSGAVNCCRIIGDLSTVSTLPVTGVPKNKLVYSVHDYPSNVSTATPDSGATTDQGRSAAWGYLETQNLAPVWVGAIGCSCDNTNGALADDQAWATDLVSYLNGGAGANGGPSFVAPKQPMGMSWYSWTQTAATTIVTPGNGTIGAGGHTWAVTAGGQITVDGVTDTTTANVTQLADVSGTIWQNTSTAGWFTEPDTSTATSHLWVSQGFATPSWLAAQNPDGTLNADGTLKSGQQAFWSQLLFTPSVAPPVITTWNPSDVSGMTLSVNNTVAAATTTNPASVRSTTSKSSGKECFEVTATSISADWDVGLANGTFSLTAPNGLGGDANGIGFDPNSTGGLQGIFLNNVVLSSGGVSSVNGERNTICEDFVAQLFWATNSAMRGAGNTWNNSPTANPATGTGGLSTAGLTCPCFITFNEFQAGTATINTAGPFAVTTPTGFSAWDSVVATTARPLMIILGANDNHPEPANDNERPANWSWNIP